MEGKRDNLLRKTARGLVKAAAWLAQMLVALALALATLALRALGAALALVTLAVNGIAEAFHVTGEAVRAITPLLLPALFRVLCVGVAIAGAALSFLPTWQAFGGDAPAALPALAVILTPAAFAVMAWSGFGGLAAAGLVTFIFSKVLVWIPAPARALVIAGLIASITIYSISHKEHKEQQKE